MERKMDHKTAYRLLCTHLLRHSFFVLFFLFFWYYNSLMMMLFFILFSFFSHLLLLLLLRRRYLLFITACQTHSTFYWTHSHTYAIQSFTGSALCCIISPAFFVPFPWLRIEFYSFHHRIRRTSVCRCFFWSFVRWFVRFFVFFFYYGPWYSRAMSETIPYVFIFVFYEQQHIRLCVLFHILVYQSW